MEQIISSITDGAYDAEKYWSGEEVIILMPMYGALQENTKENIATALKPAAFNQL